MYTQPEILYGVTYLASRYIRLHLDGRISYWSVVECIVISTSVIWWLSVQHIPCLVLNYPTMIPTDKKSKHGLMTAGLKHKMDLTRILLLSTDGLFDTEAVCKYVWSLLIVLVWRASSHQEVLVMFFVPCLSTAVLECLSIYVSST